MGAGRPARGGSAEVSRVAAQQHEAGQGAASSGLEDVVSRFGAPTRFAVPGALCAPVFRVSDVDGLALRVLFSMIWLSSEPLKQGQAFRFQAPLRDLRGAAGLATYRSHAPVRRAIDLLREERCDFADGVSIAPFASLVASEIDGAEAAEWVFSEEFAGLFVRPPRFATLDVRVLAGLVKPLDLFLYRNAMLVQRMRRPEFHLNAEELRRLADLEDGRGIKRAAEKARRAAERVATAAGVRIQQRALISVGSRALSGLAFLVESSDGSEDPPAPASRATAPR